MHLKIIAIVNILLLGSVCSYSQRCEESLNKMNELYKEGKINEAIDAGEKSLPICEKELGRESLNYAVVLENLAFFYLKEQNYEKAEPLYLDVSIINKKILGVESPKYAASLINLAFLYQTQANLTKAEALYLEVLAINKKTSEVEKLNYTNALNNLALLYQTQGNNAKAELLYLEVLDFKKNILETENPDYVTSLNSLAALYLAQANYSKAEPLYVEALDIISKILEKESPEYISSLCNLAILYYKQGNYIKSEQLFLEDLAIRKKLFGKKNPDYATSLNNLALSYSGQGNYEKAEQIYLESSAIIKEITGTEHPVYAISLNNLATLYKDQGNYEKAKLLYVEALAITKRTLGAENPDYAISLTNIATLYMAQGNYPKAEPLFVDALAIFKKTFGSKHAYYATTLVNLALLYQDQGKYPKAEQVYLEALSIRKKLLGAEHPDYANSLNNLGTLYCEQGNYAKAEPLFLQTLAIRKKILGIENPDYANSLENLAFLYQRQKKTAEAELLYLDAWDIRKKKLRMENPAYAASLNNIALLYSDQGNYAKAEPLYLEALAIRKEIWGTENPAYAASLNNLSGLYSLQGNYEKAEPLCLEALEINKKILGIESPGYINSFNNLAWVYKQTSNPLYLSYLSELLPLNQKQIIQQTSFQTTSELSAYLKANNSNYFDAKFSLAYPFNITNDSINYELYNTAVLLKNLTLRNSTQVQNRIRKSKDSVLINALEEFQEVKKQLNKYAALPKAEQPAGIKELENKTGLLEKKLITGSQAFKEAKEFTNITWKNVQQSLKKDEAAVEFVSFQYLNQKWTDSIIYAAMVIRPGYAYPKIIPLFEQKQLDNLLKRNPSLPEENFLNGLYNKENSILYNLIVKPIDSLLKGVTTIYTAPSGSLHNINLSQVISNKPDGSTFNVHILGTTGELPQYSELQLNKTTIKDAVVFGGVNYDTVSNSRISLKLPVYTPGFEQVASMTNRGGINSWTYLPGTLKEAMQVEKINTKAAIKVTVLKGDEANETSFKNLNELTSPYILHLATHGYFFPNPVQEKPQDFDLTGSDKKTVYKWAEDPLLRSGLILAGANKAWRNSTLITDSAEDGILTSMEVANVDLSNCKLAVLSACETGLGDINGSEGVFGLQRGFKLAGVKNIIMSLWKIPDTQSAELLTLFYENCFSGLSIHESLKQTQLVMSKKYPAYYWAGFTLLE